MFKCASFILLVLATPSLEQGTAAISPCPEVFMYEAGGTDPGQWYGVARLPNGSILHSLNIILDSRADRLENWVGEVLTDNNIDFQILNPDTGISPDPIVSVRFFVQFNPLSKTPRVQTIKLNGRDICNSDNTFVTRRPPSAVPKPISVPVSQSITPTRFGPNQVRCGTVVLNSNAAPLGHYAKPTLEGQWPWHIAIYTAENTDYKYTCGGTLVSRKHIVTAGHCVTTSQTESVVSINAITVYLGRHNLRFSTRNMQIGFVDKVILHPDFKGETLKNDIAIIELSDNVRYSEWVRPVCLWPNNRVQQSNIVGLTGSVVGWGKNERGVASEELGLIEMPVVDTETCVRSYEEFFIRYTSPFTYCAGFKNGTSVCTGDSGGGMVFQSDNTWYLRGVVSLSVGKLDGVVNCDTSHFSVFTDVAQYLPWIKRNVHSF